jgi:hypothetical protein
MERTARGSKTASSFPFLAKAGKLNLPTCKISLKRFDTANLVVDCIPE